MKGTPMAKLELKNEKIKNINQIHESDAQTKLALLKNQYEISLMLINDLLEDEVRQYSGERYKRDKPYEGRYSRWGTNPGSVWIGEEKVDIDIPRLYDKEEERNKTLENYELLKTIEPDETRLMKAILFGLSTNDYKAVVERFIDSRGLSRSKVSQRFIEESTKRLEEFSNRDLSGNNYVSIFIDGKYFYKEQIIIALGVTESGSKVALGFIQTTTENSTSIKQLLSNLIERGLKYENGLLFVIDGSKGIHKAVTDTFGKEAVIQRCQWHKRENVISYLNEDNKDRIKRKMSKAYNMDTYQEAKDELMKIHYELGKINRNAANSLLEGLEETLTLHRLGINEEFKKSFSTTNVIENLNSQIGKYTRKVKYWKTSDQRQRWIAAGLMEAEQKMRRVNNYQRLYILQEKIKEEVEHKIINF
jgi:putative transposase